MPLSLDEYPIEDFPVSPSVGAEVGGIDLSQPLTEEQFRDVKEALGQLGVLSFRDQDTTPDHHLRFAKAFGEIAINRFFHHVDGFPEIANVQRQPDEKGATGGYWHTDHSYDQVPAMGSVFVAREIPPVGGDTLFAGMAAAFDSLSPGLQSVLEVIEAWHSDKVCPEVSDPMLQRANEARLPGLKTAGTRAKHPAVIRDPISGRKVLYVNSGFTERFDGWKQSDLGHCCIVSTPMRPNRNSLTGIVVGRGMSLSGTTGPHGIARLMIVWAASVSFTASR